MSAQQLDLLNYRRPSPRPTPVYAPELQHAPKFGIVGAGQNSEQCSVSVIGPGMEPMGIGRLKRVLEELPQHHDIALQVHASVTAPRFRQAVGYVARGGQINPYFLDARYFLQEIWQPTHKAIGRRLKLVMFTFPHYLGAAGIGRGNFAERLSSFLGCLPANLPAAIEVRDPYHLGLDYARTLARHNASHIYSCGPGMPNFVSQKRWVPSSKLVVFRLSEQLNGQYPSHELRNEAVAARVRHESTSKQAFVLLDYNKTADAQKTMAELYNGLI